MPYWVERLESVDAGEGDTAMFHCRASGTPAPDHFWFINGTPIASEYTPTKCTQLIVRKCTRPSAPHSS